MTDAPQLRRINRLHVEDSKVIATSNGRVKARAPGAGCLVEKGRAGRPHQMSDQAERAESVARQRGQPDCDAGPSGTSGQRDGRGCVPNCGGRDR
jgi:hypothetical protein